MAEAAPAESTVTPFIGEMWQNFSKPDKAKETLEAGLTDEKRVEMDLIKKALNFVEWGTGKVSESAALVAWDLREKDRKLRTFSVRRNTAWVINRDMWGQIQDILSKEKLADRELKDIEIKLNSIFANFDNITANDGQRLKKFKLPLEQMNFSMNPSEAKSTSGQTVFNELKKKVDAANSDNNYSALKHGALQADIETRLKQYAEEFLAEAMVAQGIEVKAKSVDKFFGMGLSTEADFEDYQKAYLFEQLLDQLYVIVLKKFGASELAGVDNPLGLTRTLPIPVETVDGQIAVQAYNDLKYEIKEAKHLPQEKKLKIERFMLTGEKDETFDFSAYLTPAKVREYRQKLGFVNPDSPQKVDLSGPNVDNPANVFLELFHEILFHTDGEIKHQIERILSLQPIQMLGDEDNSSTALYRIRSKPDIKGLSPGKYNPNRAQEAVGKFCALRDEIQVLLMSILDPNKVIMGDLGQEQKSHIELLSTWNKSALEGKKLDTKRTFDYGTAMGTAAESWQKVLDLENREYDDDGKMKQKEDFLEYILGGGKSVGYTAEKLGQETKHLFSNLVKARDAIINIRPDMTLQSGELAHLQAKKDFERVWNNLIAGKVVKGLADLPEWPKEPKFDAASWMQKWLQFTGPRLIITANGVELADLSTNQQAELNKLIDELLKFDTRSAGGFYGGTDNTKMPAPYAQILLSFPPAEKLVKSRLEAHKNRLKKDNIDATAAAAIQSIDTELAKSNSWDMNTVVNKQQELVALQQLIPRGFGSGNQSDLVRIQSWVDAYEENRSTSTFGATNNTDSMQASELIQNHLQIVEAKLKELIKKIIDQGNDPAGQLSPYEDQLKQLVPDAYRSGALNLQVLERWVDPNGSRVNPDQERQQFNVEVENYFNNQTPNNDISILQGLDAQISAPSVNIDWDTNYPAVKGFIELGKNPNPSNFDYPTNFGDFPNQLVNLIQQQNNQDTLTIILTLLRNALNRLRLQNRTDSLTADLESRMREILKYENFDQDPDLRNAVFKSLANTP